MFHQLSMTLMKNSQKKREAFASLFLRFFYFENNLTTSIAKSCSKKACKIGQKSILITLPPFLHYLIPFEVELLDLLLFDNTPKGWHQRYCLLHYLYT